jgi:hypothetical protein
MQTNIWQDPYVKSEGVLFLYELDTDAHTAAMMMCQEEEQGMFEQEVFGALGGGALGNPGFGNGATAGGVSNYLEIPQSLPSSMLSALGGTSASYSSEQGTASKTICSSGSEAALPTLSSPALSSENNKDFDIGAGSAADDNAQNGEAATSSSNNKAEEGLNSSMDLAVKASSPAQSAHLPLTLEDIDFVVTPNRGAPLVANRKFNGKEMQGENGGDSVVKAWECAPFQVSGDAALVCVSGMAPLYKEAAPVREVRVSILRLPDREQVCCTSLCCTTPSQILQLPGEEVDGCTYTACFEEIERPASSEPTDP